MSKFKTLDMPYQWQEYFTKYPHGYTLWEALANWLKEVNYMVDELNDWSSFVKIVEKKLDNVEQSIKDDVLLVLDGWKNDGSIYEMVEAVSYGVLNKKADKSFVDSLLLTLNSKANESLVSSLANNVALKADKTYVDNLVMGLTQPELESFSGLSAIETKYPNGHDKVVLNMTNGHLYYWDNDQWTKGWEYAHFSEGNLEIRGYFSANENADNLVGSGVWQLTSGNVGKVLNLPVNKTGVLVQFFVGSGVGGKLQIYASQHFMYVRYSSSTGFWPWRLLSENNEFLNKDALILKSGKDKIITPWEVKGTLWSERGNKNINVGEIFPSMPYASSLWRGQDILWNRSLSNYYSMVYNPASELYQSGMLEYSGSVCSSTSCWLAGQDIYWTTTELWDVLDFIDYQGIESLNIGDVLMRSGHSITIIDLGYNSIGGGFVEIVEGSSTTISSKKIDLQEFENMLDINGGIYSVGRFKEVKPRIIDRIDYPTNVLPIRGHKSVFQLGEDIKITINSGNTLYYKKVEDPSYKTVNVSQLPKTTYSNISIYDVTSLISTHGNYEFTTTPGVDIALIMVVDRGNIVYNNNTFKVEGYSDNLEPVWFQLNVLTNVEGNTSYPAPVGYVASLNYGNKGYIEGVTEFPIPDNIDGYYIRAYYKSDYGFIHLDGDYIIL